MSNEMGASVVTDHKLPMSAPHAKCSKLFVIPSNIQPGRDTYKNCNNLAEVWLVNEIGEVLLNSGSLCSECAALVVNEWDAAFPGTPWSTIPIVPYRHPCTDETETLQDWSVAGEDLYCNQRADMTEIAPDNIVEVPDKKPKVNVSRLASMLKKG